MAKKEIVVETKPWFKSKGKLGGVVVGVGSALVLVGQFIGGGVDAATLINGLIGIGSGLGIFGIRAALD